MTDLSRHPCFSNRAHGRYGRLHIPCAPRCNLSCAFCGRGLDAGERQLPGRTHTIVTPENVRAYVAQRLERHPEIEVLGIAGPGEPLYNPETFQVLEILQRAFPAYALCLGSNGLLLPEAAERLWTLGVRTITVTVNAISPQVGVRLTPWLRDAQGIRREGAEAARLLIARQLDGVKRSAELGMAVKVNTVFVPGVNDGEVEAIAKAVRERGAWIMNVMPLKPAGRLADMPVTSPAEIHEVRRRLEKTIPQLQHCAQCRADACGIPGADDVSADGCIK